MSTGVVVVSPGDVVPSGDVVSPGGAVHSGDVIHSGEGISAARETVSELGTGVISVAGERSVFT